MEMTMMTPPPLMMKVVGLANPQHLSRERIAKYKVEEEKKLQWEMAVQG